MFPVSVLLNVVTTIGSTNSKMWQLRGEGLFELDLIVEFYLNSVTKFFLSVYYVTVPCCLLV